jgi:hypothetical protein
LAIAISVRGHSIGKEVSEHYEGETLGFCCATIENSLIKEATPSAFSGRTPGETSRLGFLCGPRNERVVMPAKAGIQYPPAFVGARAQGLLDRPVEPGDDKEERRGQPTPFASPRRKPGSGAATLKLLSWIPAFAGMTEGKSEA